MDGAKRDLVECPRCGEQAAASDRYCGRCGATLAGPGSPRPARNDVFLRRLFLGYAVVALLVTLLVRENLRLSPLDVPLVAFGVWAGFQLDARLFGKTGVDSFLSPVVLAILLTSALEAVASPEGWSLFHTVRVGGAAAASVGIGHLLALGVLKLADRLRR